MTIKILDHVAVGLPIARRGISFLPVYLAGNDLPAMTTGAESGLTIEELARATVPTLMAHNPTDRPILVVEGEHWLGGKQNRALNATILVPPNSELEIPVSCLEQGRWSHRRAQYRRSTSYAPRRVRQTTVESVNRSAERSGRRDSAQGAVWHSIGAELQEANVQSESDAAEDLHRRFEADTGWRDAVAELEAMGPLPQQCGFVVSHGDRAVAAELFGSRDLLAVHWSALIRSYLREHPIATGYAPCTRSLYRLRDFGRVAGHTQEGVGMGWEKRVSGKTMVGQALMLEQGLVHASIFFR